MSAVLSIGKRYWRRGLRARDRWATDPCCVDGNDIGCHSTGRALLIPTSISHMYNGANIIPQVSQDLPPPAYCVKYFSLGDCLWLLGKGKAERLKNRLATDRFFGEKNTLSWRFTMIICSWWVKHYWNECLHYALKAIYGMIRSWHNMCLSSVTSHTAINT